MAPVATLAAHWLQEPQPISYHPVGLAFPHLAAITQLGWRFHTLRGGTDPGDLRFRPRVVGVVEIWKDS